MKEDYVGAIAIKQHRPEAERMLSEFLAALREAIYLPENIECEITRAKTKEKGFDDDIELVERTTYMFYDTKSNELLFEVKLEDRSHTGRFAKIGISKKLKSMIRGLPKFSAVEGYEEEYYWTLFITKKLLRK